jgi:hypothetical protein
VWIISALINYYMKLLTKFYAVLLSLVALSNYCAAHSIYHWSDKTDFTKNQERDSSGFPEATLSSDITMSSDCAFLSSATSGQTITIPANSQVQYSGISMVNMPPSANAQFFFIDSSFAYFQIINGAPYVTVLSTNYPIAFGSALATGLFIIRHLDCFLFLL